MLVGTKSFPVEELRRNATSKEEIVAYAESLVPLQIRHNQSIVYNQRYVVALVLREVKSIEFSKRKELCEALLHDIYLTGVMDIIVDYDDIMSRVDTVKLNKALERFRDLKERT